MTLRKTGPTRPITSPLDYVERDHRSGRGIVGGLMREFGLESQAEFAALSGLDEATVSRLRSNKQTRAGLSRETAKRLLYVISALPPAPRADMMGRWSGWLQKPALLADRDSLGITTEQTEALEDDASRIARQFVTEDAPTPRVVAAASARSLALAKAVALEFERPPIDYELRETPGLLNWRAKISQSTEWIPYPNTWIKLLPSELSLFRSAGPRAAVWEHDRTTHVLQVRADLVQWTEMFWDTLELMNSLSNDAVLHNSRPLMLLQATLEFLDRGWARL